MEYITLKERTGLKRFGIRTQDGVDTGEYIEIDLEDLDLPLKSNECQAKHFENFETLKRDLAEAEKKSSEKNPTDILSEKEKATIEAYKKFYEAEIEALDGFLGEGATRKLLGGRKPYLTMYDDINDYLEQIVPILKDTQNQVIERIKSKYGTIKEDNIL